MSKRKSKSYVPTPSVPEATQARYEAVLKVLSGELSVSEAARQLNMSRNHFQTLMHRGLEGLITELGPKPRGRPKKPEDIAAMEEELDELRRDNAQLQEHVAMTQRMLGMVSGVLKGEVKLRPPARQSKARSKKRKTKTTTEDSDDEHRARLDGACAMIADGAPATLSACAVGVSPATLRRWRRRARCGDALVRRRGPGPRAAPSPDARAAVAQCVRQSRGLLGADALRTHVGTVSRRQAAAIKRDTLTAIERERRAAAARVQVTAPGVIRGFDAMHVPTTAGRRYALIAGDACVPYRTSAVAVRHYDGDAVADALERDIAAAGPPLVVRMDRAACHRVARVRDVLNAHGIVVLHGPRRYPRYYGQLERQNREHRAWLRAGDVLAPDALDADLARMTDVLNAMWSRPSLSRRTASELWQLRPALAIDRDAFRDEVSARTARVRASLCDTRDADELAKRLAIEAALRQHGFLEVTPGTVLDISTSI